MAGPNYAEQVTSGNTQLSNPEQIFAGATGGINATASAANGLTYVSSGQVYMGGELKYIPRDDATGRSRPHRGRHAMAYPTVSVDSAQRQFWSLSADEMMQIDGYIKAETGFAPKTMASRKDFWDGLVLRKFGFVRV